METGHAQGSNAPQGSTTGEGANLKVPLNLLTQTFRNLSKRAATREMKHYLFVVCEGIGEGIAKQYPDRTGPGSGFNTETWMKECGVDAEWATLAA